MKPALTFTLDLEDHRPDKALEKRYPAMTEKILSFLDAHNVKATVFTVATLAAEAPDLVRRIHAAGHEIAHHSYDHTLLTKQTPPEFRAATLKGKNILEDIIGTPVTGYRAPVFSLTKETLWAVDILKELGFSYSSSVLPVANPLYGFPGASFTPFRWPNGLVEIPAPVGRLGPLSLPYLGGFYLRYLPFFMVKFFLSHAEEDSLLWTYCHPYDFDTEEKNWRIKGASLPVSLLLWLNRKKTFAKMQKLLDCCTIMPPFAQQDFSKIT